jgi:hypothetical protein
MRSRAAQKASPLHVLSRVPVLAQTLCLGVCLVATSAQAHRPLNTTIEGALHLNETELRHDIKVAHFLLPPTMSIPAEQLPTAGNGLRPIISQYVTEQHPVTIDGIQVPPTIQNLALEAVENAPYLNTTTNFVRVTFTATYAIKMPPKQISMVWKLFPGTPAEGWSGIVDSDQDPYEIIQTFDVRGEGDFVFFAPSEPEFVWHAEPAGRGFQIPLEPDRSQCQIPILSVLLSILAGLYLASPAFRGRPLRIRLVLSGGLLVMACLGSHLLTVHVPNPLRRVSMPADEEALSIFTALHANIYRAFDYSREEEVYDVLAQSVDGALLDDLYAQIYRSLILRYSGGAVCRVSKVEILEATVVEKRRGAAEADHVVAIECQWRVQGIVEHWEHLHRRINEYQAHFELSPRAGSWKMCGVDITRQERVTAEDTPLGERLKDES